MPISPETYLCGCNIKAKRGYFHELDDKGRSITSRTDRFGFDICPEHGERRYGWRAEVTPMRGGAPMSTGELNLPPSTVDDLRPQAPQARLGGRSLAVAADEYLRNRELEKAISDI